MIMWKTRLPLYSYFILTYGVDNDATCVRFPFLPDHVTELNWKLKNLWTVTIAYVSTCYINYYNNYNIVAISLANVCVVGAWHYLNSQFLRFSITIWSSSCHHTIKIKIKICAICICLRQQHLIIQDCKWNIKLSFVKICSPQVWVIFIQ